VTDVDRTIESLLSEERVFEPPAAFGERALARDRSIYDTANADPQAFWAEQARQLDWIQPWDSLMDWTPPWVTWFAGAS
jgi:acetyl-CoA synthetase